jgi:hypothetical protein
MACASEMIMVPLTNPIWLIKRRLHLQMRNAETASGGRETIPEHVGCGADHRSRRILRALVQGQPWRSPVRRVRVLAEALSLSTTVAKKATASMSGADSSFRWAIWPWAASPRCMFTLNDDALCAPFALSFSLTRTECILHAAW